MDEILGTNSGCTPTLYAVQGGCLSCVRFLLEKAGADIRAVSNRGHLPYILIEAILKKTAPEESFKSA